MTNIENDIDFRELISFTFFANQGYYSSPKDPVYENLAIPSQENGYLMDRGIQYDCNSNLADLGIFRKVAPCSFEPVLSNPETLYKDINSENHMMKLYVSLELKHLDSATALKTTFDFTFKPAFFILPGKDSDAEESYQISNISPSTSVMISSLAQLQFHQESLNKEHVEL